MSAHREETTSRGTPTSRRELIRKTLAGAGTAYVAMAVLDSYVGPKIGRNGMPAHAVSLIVN